jgi:hypothetical protein
MTPVKCIVAVTVLLSAAFAGTAGQAAIEDLKSPRQALGGQALERVRGFRAEGESTRVVATLRLSTDIELLLERPDRFLRVDRLRMAGGLGGETASGFVGDRFIQRIPGPRSSSAAAAAVEQREDFRRAAATGLRQELRLLLLGMFAGTFDDSPLQIERIGMAESPEARAEALRLTFSDGFVATLFIHADTHLPLMVAWQGADPSAILRLATAAGPAEAGALVAAGQAATVEHRLHFSDYRRIDALRWPFLVRHTAAGAPVEELRFDRFALNPIIKPGTFAEGE